MTTQKKVLKWLIICILAVFLLSTALMSVMYLTGKAPQDPNTIPELDTASDTGVVTNEVNQ